jgi:cation diffusion facilitator CzcD-associated flavoprotein CzcO
MDRTAPRAPDHEVVIVGAGFGGMGAAIQLGWMGIDSILILDRADDLGGTWHVNTYPGIAVDVASVTYSYSFEPNPHWSRRYAPGAELAAYARRVADKYRLRRFMRFHSNVERAAYDEESRSWTVTIEGQPPVTARVLILATGYLSQPKLPEIEGLGSFAGKTMHTARWDHGYDLAGKRAAVIGTGATSVQLLPEIAPKLAELHVYQRTPIWVAPKNDRAIPLSQREIFAKLPITQRLARLGSNALLELMLVTGALHHKELPFLSRALERVCRAHLKRQIPDRELREKLTPRYSFGCKRPTFSNDYYLTFNRPNVELITEPVDRIEPGGVVTCDGRRRAVDALVLATGYKVWEKGSYPPFDVVGKGGVELRRYWDENHYQAYEGITIPGFPNLFNLPSPYSFTGLSYFFTIEGQMKHIARCLGEMRRKGARSFEVTQAANDAYLREMRGRMQSTVFLNGDCAPARSYYFNQHGEAALARPMPTLLALWRSGHFPLDHYRFG